jgi:hypothetical protein
MTWILAVVLAATPEPQNLEFGKAVAAVESELRPGSLIFSRGDCLAVKVFTVSPYTHVGTVLERGGRFEVYDSNPGTGTRRLSLSEYVAAQGTAPLHIFQPVRPWSDSERARISAHLEQELGRPYAILHHVTGEPCEGLHCAEYATQALMAGELLTAKKPARVSPATLREGILQDEVYRHVATIQVLPERASPPDDAGWCGRMWFSTKECSGACYRKMRGWFCCK